MTTVEKRSKKNTDILMDTALDSQDSLNHEDPPSPFASIWKIFVSPSFLGEGDSNEEAKAATKDIINFCVKRKLPLISVDAKLWLLPTSSTGCKTYFILGNDLSSEDGKLLDSMILKLSSLLPHMKSSRENN